MAACHLQDCDMGVFAVVCCNLREKTVDLVLY